MLLNPTPSVGFSLYKNPAAAADASLPLLPGKILQMNLLEHSFFAFRDTDADGAFAVVYKRNDDGYGIIEDVQ